MIDPARPALPTRFLGLVLIACLALGYSLACSAPPAKSKPLTPLNELPERYADAWMAFTQDLETWPALRETVRDDPQLSRFFVNNLVRVLVHSYQEAAIATAGQKAGAFERSSRELLYLRDASGPVLVELVMVGDTIVSFLAGDLLQRMDEGRWSLAMSRQLENEDPEERRRAAEWLSKLPQAGDGENKIFERLSAALEDSAWSVRSEVCLALAARSLARGRIDLARAPLSLALTDQNSSVVQVACEALRRTGDRAALPALINALERAESSADDLATQGTIQHTLLALSGETEARNASRWRGWWRVHRR